jgi:hypothetical protein
MAVEEPKENIEQTEEQPEVIELEALRVENEELIDTVQRVKAEFDNYRKRAAGGAAGGGGGGRGGGRRTWSRGPASE